MPYALVVAGVVTLFGYAPVAYGYSPVTLLPVATLVLLLVIQFGGRPAIKSESPSEPEKKPADAPAAAPKEAAQKEAAKGGTDGRKPAAA